MFEPPMLVVEHRATQPDDTADANPFQGRRIGQYTLGARLGIGGMSIVYAAKQDKPSRSVAIKLLRVGLSGPMAQRRFDREAEILGRLRHPAIAQIYEAGRYESELGSIPFFAMELLHGALPLTQYAIEHQLTVKQRLVLFVEV
ncbi:MAG: hypothetical protein JKY37_27260, partial [Nannocystaceae bacterium]|nr:hypothetical protein [Nannocystaceae bacterium]